MKIEDIIKQLAIDDAGSLRAFCDKHGLEYQTINKSLMRSVLRSSFQNTLRICEGLGLDPYALARGKIEYMGDISPKDHKRLDAFSNISPREQDIVDFILGIDKVKASKIQTLPIYGFSAAAGWGNELCDETAASVDIAVKPAVRKANFVVSIIGDSMEPMFRSGDFVAVEKCDELSCGEVGIFVLNGAGYIKVYEKDGLVSINGAYNTIAITPLDSFKVIGRVLGSVEVVK